MKKHFIFLALFVSALSLFSQRGKDGTVTIGASTVVNVYTSLPSTVNLVPGNVTIPVTSTVGFAAGDLIYIIQVQGASTNVIPEPTNTVNAFPMSDDFGRITNYNNTGNNEYAQINNISGNNINVDCGINYAYTGAGKVQVIRVPRFAQLTVNSGGIITCPQWNGTTGGVIAIEVMGNTVINLGGRIDASGLGFRGGLVTVTSYTHLANTGANNWGHLNKTLGMYKGESIVGDTAVYQGFSAKFARGAIGNGGGGGCQVNAGGGGGSNAGDTSLWTGKGVPDNSFAGWTTAWNLEAPGFAASSSSGGGRGGYSYSSSNNNPVTTPPGAGNGWAGDNRRIVGGLGGRPLNYNTGRLFIGGGGGSGDEDDAYGGIGGVGGGDGGGIIDITSYGAISGAGLINSNGADGSNTNAPGAGFNQLTGKDGAGGGGGGGAIKIRSIGTITGITINAAGGNGGNQQMRSGYAVGGPGDAYGPGGGGGGGYIGANTALPTTNVAGGNNGQVIYLAGSNGCLIDNNFPPNGATRGRGGIATATLATQPTITVSPTTATICVNNSVSLTAGNSAGYAMGWYYQNPGGSFVGFGSAFTTSVYTTPGTYTVSVGHCPDQTYRAQCIITVITGPTLTVNSPTICAGQTATLNGSGATTYTWNTGPITGTINVTPTVTTTYTLAGTVATCSSNITTTVNVISAPSITAAPVSICNGQTATLTASGATTYTWNTGPTTNSIAVTPTTTTNYTVTGSVGTCTNVQTTTVTVNSLPSVTATSGTICVGAIATLTAGGATTYTWNTGPTTTTIAVTPTITTNYTVTGNNGTCSNTQTTSVIVNPLPTVTATSGTICAGQSLTLTAGGASTYTWNTGPTTATIVLSPTTTTNYTVTGSNGTCSNTRTTSITVAPLPTVTATSGTICAGQQVILTAGGATTYTWNTGPTNATIAVSPTTTTNYTVTGNNGTCSNTQTTSVIVNPLPTLTATSGSICAGQSLTLTAGGASTYTWNTGPTTATIVLSPTTTTNYTVTGNNGTCSNTQTTSITVVPLPTVTATSATICAGGSATLTAGGATTYTWNTGPTTPSITVTPTTTTNYTVAGSTGACSNTRTTQVVVNPIPTITVNSPTLCSGQTTTLTAGGASTYTWSPGPLTGSSVTVSPGTTQVYTVTATSSLSCTGTNTTSVSVTATPTLNVPSATICPGNTATLTASGATSYTWNPGGSTGSTFTATPPASQTYTVTGANGACTSTQTVSINIGSAISIIVNSATICPGSTATLTASGATTYTWSTSSNSTSITVNPSSTTVYTISGTNSSCTGVNTATVTVNPTPTVTTASTSICSGQTATLTASGATTYTWNPGSLSGTSVTVSPTSTQNYTVIGSSVDGCTNTAISNVSVTPSPTVVVQPMSICPGGTGTLTAFGAGSYTWTPGNVTGSSYTASPSSTTNYTVTGSNGLCVSSATADITVGISLTVAINSPTICAGQSTILSASVSATSYTWNTGANTSTVVVSPTTTTSYTVDVTSPGCNGTGTTTVFVNALPTVTVNGAAICSGQMVTLTASGASNYTWTPSGVNGSTFAVAPSTSTTYSVIGETGGCTNIATTDVTVTPTPTLTVNSPTICGGSATLTASGATNYTWSPGGQNTSSIVVSPSTTSFYTIDAANGSCFTTTTTMVYVNSAPPLFISITNPSPFCPGTCSTFSTTAGYGLVVFDYGDATGTTTNTTHCYAASGIYTVTASGTFTSGCSITTSTVIALSFLPVNTVTFDVLGTPPYQIGTAVSFTSYGTSGNWTFGDGTSLTNVPDPMHAFNSGGTYCIKMASSTTTLGCADSLTKCIDIFEPVTINIPNVFTPNADNSNDVFKVTGSGIIDFHCVILDRWGLRMCEWDGLGGGWDGYTKAGVQAPTGTYFYIISYRTADGKGDVVKGPVSLFKD